MQRSYQLGKYGTVYAERREVHENERNYKDNPQVTHKLHFYSRCPGPDWDSTPGLKINGIEYHLTATVLREEYADGHSRCWYKHWSLQRPGILSAPATQSALNAVHGPILELAAKLCEDLLWLAETDVELAEEAHKNAVEAVANAETALLEAQQEEREAAARIKRRKEELHLVRELTS